MPKYLRTLRGLFRNRDTDIDRFSSFSRIVKDTERFAQSC